MRICCVIASLGAGGAERVMLELCRAWSSRGDDVVLVTLDDGLRDFYAAPPQVQRVALGVAGKSAGAASAVMANARRLREVRRAIRDAQPDVVVSFTDRTNVVVLLATRTLGIPVVVSERIDPRWHNIGRVWTGLRRATYPSADLLVVQTNDVVPWAQQVTRSSRVRTIANPARAVSDDVTPAGTRPLHVVALGRLVPQKGFDTLIEAFGRAHRKFPEWSLSIYGEGPGRTALSDQIERASLQHAVRLAGRTSEADVVLRNASIFVLSSRYEGFPNALLEASVAGCACVSTNCPSGPADIISHDQSGLLVPVDDIAAMSGALQRVMGDDTLRTRFGAAAREACARFDIGQILREWDRVFAAVRNVQVAA